MDLRKSRVFRAVVREMAARWIERVGADGDHTQHELRMLAHAHLALGDPETALALLVRAAGLRGPYTRPIEAEVAALRAALESGAVGRLRLAPPSR